MYRQVKVSVPLLALLATAMACSSHSSSPTTPTADPAIGATAAASDGSTLKVSAPGLVSPVGGVQLTDANATLRINAVNGKYGSTTLAFNYRYQVMTNSGTVIEEKTSAATSFTTTAQFDVKTTYKWRARAEYQGAFGPWSNTETFVSLDKVNGYIRGNELYDPMTEGKTIGAIFGSVTWHGAQGVEMDSESSYIQYQLQNFLAAGEMSALITNVGVVSPNEDPKDRIFSMREGDAAINDNIYRMTVDKRGNGAIAWRFLSGQNCGGCYIETTGGERQVYPFHESLTYFVKATWGHGSFNVQFREGGVNGNVIYDFGKQYDREYTPAPHMVFAGSPYQGGDRGDPATIEGMIIRQLWVSGNPRPSFANQ